MQRRSNPDPVFGTPKPRSKVRSRVQPTRRENEDTEDKVKEFKQKSGEFATPKVANSKPKIIHKEKLRSSGVLSKPSVPTAQVYPSPITTTKYGSSTVNGHGGDMSYGMKHGWENDSLSNTTLTDSTVLHTTGTHINSTRGDMSRLLKDDDFEELTASNMTLDTTNLFPGTKTTSPYSKTIGGRARDLNHDIDDLARTTSALSVRSHSMSNLSDPSLHLYGGDSSGFSSGMMKNPDVYSQHMPSKYQPHTNYRSGFDTMPPSFQAASFAGPGIGGGFQMSHNPMMSQTSIPPQLGQSRQGEFNSGYNMGNNLNFSNDLSDWQQKHQQQLQRQQIDAQTGVVNGSSGTFSPTPVGTILPSNDPTRLDAVKKAADNIISEKDNIIDRQLFYTVQAANLQKLKIMELERQTRESEVEMHKSLLRRVQGEGESLGLKLQEAHYENASIKAQLTEMMSARSKDLNDLEKKLAASEYELHELKGSLEKEMATKNREVKELQNKLEDRDGVVNDYKDKYGALKKSNEELEKKVSTLERYLSDLPTADEHIRKHTEIRNLKEDKLKYKHRAQELEKRLKDVTKGVSSRDSLIESLEHTEKDLRDRVEQLQNERDSLAEEVCKLRADGASIPEEDFAELEEENRRLKTEFDKAKRLLDTQHKKLQQAEVQHQQELVRLEERLAQDEGSVSALREEMGEKDEHLRKLRQSVKELGSQNQDLLEQSLMLKDKVKEYENQHTGEAKKLERRLMKELAVCFADLQSLVQICVQHAEGQDPNISVLLGIRASMGEFDVTESQGDHLQSLKFKVTKVKELRTEIDKMRELLSNKYAEDMGENLNCTTQ